MFKRLVYFVNTYSLLIPLGALSTGYFFYRFAQSEISYWFFWLLPSSMWMIYAADHFLDGYRLNAHYPDAPARYTKMFNLKSWLLPLLWLVGGFNAVLALVVFEYKALFLGSSLALVSAVYLWLQHRFSPGVRGAVKELLIALVATAGMGAFPYIDSFQPLFTPEALLILAVFFLLNMANLRLFSRFEQSDDARYGFRSTAGVDDERNSRSVQYLLIAAYLVCGIWLFLLNDPFKVAAVIVMLFMNNVLMLINQWPGRFRKADAYRFWGDFIYILPAPIAWWFGI